MYRVPAKYFSYLVIAVAIVSGKAYASSLLDLSKSAFGTTPSVVHLGESAQPQAEAQQTPDAAPTPEPVNVTEDAPTPDWMAEALPTVMRGAIAAADE